MKKLRSFRNNQRGIVHAGIIAIVFIVLSSIIWIIGALIVNKTFDQLQGIIATCDPQVASISQNAVNGFGVMIVIIDVGLVIWWGLSAQRVESQESPAAYGGY